MKITTNKREFTKKMKITKNKKESTLQELKERLPSDRLNQIWADQNYSNYINKVVDIIILLYKGYGYTFMQLELLTTIDSTYLNKIMNGKKKSMTVDYLTKFMEGLGVKNNVS